MYYADIRWLTKEYGTNWAFVRQLISGGIPEKHVQDVLGIREANAFTYEAKDHFGYTVEREESISAKHLVAIYTMVSGDLDMMISAFECAAERATEQIRYREFPRRGIYAAAINSILKDGISALYEY